MTKCLYLDALLDNQFLYIALSKGSSALEHGILSRKAHNILERYSQGLGYWDKTKEKPIFWFVQTYETRVNSKSGFVARRHDAYLGKTSFR